MINIINDLPKHPTKQYGTRSLDQIQMIVVHHFAGEMSIKNAARMHAEKNDWPGIGYHMVIDLDGTLYVTNNLRTISYHCGGHNTRSVGIALRGKWSKKEPPARMLESLEDAIELVRWAVGRDIPVYPHSAFRPTECPGDPLREYLERLRVYLTYSYTPMEDPDNITNDDDYERPNQP